MDLVCKLNTEENRAVNQDENACIYKRFTENEAKEYRHRSFSDIIGGIIKDCMEGDESMLASEIGSYLNEDDGINKTFEIRAYDSEGIEKRNHQNERSNVMKLSDVIEPYIDKRAHDGVKYECLDMVVTLNTKVGYGI